MSIVRVPITNVFSWTTLRLLPEVETWISENEDAFKKWYVYHGGSNIDAPEEGEFHFYDDSVAAVFKLTFG